MSRIERRNSVTATLALTDSASTSAPIPFGPAAGGILIVDALATGTKIAWHAAFTPGDTPRPVYSDGSAVETSIAVNRAYPIPDACFAAPVIVAVLDAGTASIRVSLKG